MKLLGNTSVRQVNVGLLLPSWGRVVRRHKWAYAPKNEVALLMVAPTSLVQIGFVFTIGLAAGHEAENFLTGYCEKVLKTLEIKPSAN